MSNFQTFALITEGNTSTAPSEFIASTIDSFVQITTPGYLNDLKEKIKANDLITINYEDTSVFPLNTGESSVLTRLTVTYNPGTENYSLVQPVFNKNGLTLLEDYGFHNAALGTTGGGATTTYIDSLVNRNTSVFAQFSAYTVPSSVDIVTPADGSFSTEGDVAPGVSTLTYFSITPSALLESKGIHVSQYTYAGGSATFVVTDPLITTNSVMLANFVDSDTVVRILTVAPHNGSFTVVCSANPGEAILSYIASARDGANTIPHLHVSSQTNAGAGASITLNDAEVLTTSLVIGCFSSVTTPASINRALAGTGTISFGASAAPGPCAIQYIVANSTV